MLTDVDPSTAVAEIENRGLAQRTTFREERLTGTQDEVHLTKKVGPYVLGEKKQVAAVPEIRARLINCLGSYGRLQKEGTL